MLVRTGSVRISHPSTEGRSFLLAELGPGAVFGEIALLDGGPRSADVTAVSRRTLLVFERRDFVPLLEHNWPLAEAVLKMVCERLRRADAYIADLAFSDLPGAARQDAGRPRPARAGRRSRRSTTRQGALAAMIGGSREAVNRCLRKWQKTGLIAHVRGPHRPVRPRGAGAAGGRGKGGVGGIVENASD